MTGETPEDLLPEELKHLPQEIKYQTIGNLLPPFSDIAEAELHTQIVSKLLQTYLKTIKLERFLKLYQDYLEDTEGMFSLVWLKIC